MNKCKAGQSLKKAPHHLVTKATLEREGTGKNTRLKRAFFHTGKRMSRARGGGCVEGQWKNSTIFKKEMV